MPTPSNNFRYMNRTELINILRTMLKKEKAVQKVLKKHGLNDSVIDHVSIKFEPLDVSAKTVDGTIILNEKLLDSELRDIIRYVAHELCHVGQQLTSDVSEDLDKDYLDQDGEVEAFQTQIDVMEEMYDPEEIQVYLDGLMKHHDIHGKERLQKIKELKK
jgi:hypothetical protein